MGCQIVIMRLKVSREMEDHITTIKTANSVSAVLDTTNPIST